MNIFTRILGSVAVLTNLFWIGSVPPSANVEVILDDALNDDVQEEDSEGTEDETVIGNWSEEKVSRKGGETKWEDKCIHDESVEGFGGLELRTLNGNLTVIGSDKNTVHIVAFRTVKTTDEKKGNVYREGFHPAIRIKGKTLVVKTRRPEEKNEGRQSRPKYIKEASMSYEVTIPSRFLVKAETVNGVVKIKDVEENAELGTVNGNIELTASEGLNKGVVAQSVNGNIHIHAPRLMNKSEMSVVNGNINLRVPNDAKFQLRAKVGMSGSIRTDWGKPGKSGLFGSSYEISVNDGGDAVELQTLNGNIRVGTSD